MYSLKSVYNALACSEERKKTFFHSIHYKNNKIVLLLEPFPRVCVRLSTSRVSTRFTGREDNLLMNETIFVKFSLLRLASHLSVHDQTPTGMFD